MAQRLFAIFIGLIFGSFCVYLIATQVAKPLPIVKASYQNDQTIHQEETQETIQSQAAEINNTQVCALPGSYPASIQNWCEVIQSTAQQYQLDAALLAAVMLQESGGNPEAYSKSGAVGLMQVMPRDGLAEKFQCINGPCFANRPSMDELFEPAFNIDYGSRMLANLFSKHGDWREALKAYGPMDVGYYYADLVLDIYKNYQ